MTVQEYLEAVLSEQNLKEDSAELKELQSQRAKVEKLLCDEFGSVPTIRYGGSKAKGTLIKEYYDLDIVCYLPYDSDVAGKTLEEIYQNVQKALEKSYYVEEKTSALRLKGKDAKEYQRDFHIDVVPGRFTDDKKADCYIYQKSAEKCRLKTNLDVHVQHIKGSGVVDALRLLKLWKVRKTLRVKQFVFELLIIDLLEGKKAKSLEDQLNHVWTKIKDSSDPINLKDPANPNGNDFTEFVKNMWPQIQAAASSTLQTIETFGWESVFGTVSKSSNATIVEKAQRAAASVSSPTRPWCE